MILRFAEKTGTIMDHFDNREQMLMPQEEEKKHNSPPLEYSTRYEPDPVSKEKQEKDDRAYAEQVQLGLSFKRIWQERNDYMIAMRLQNSEGQ